MAAEVQAALFDIRGGGDADGGLRVIDDNVGMGDNWDARAAARQYEDARAAARGTSASVPGRHTDLSAGEFPPLHLPSAAIAQSTALRRAEDAPRRPPRQRARTPAEAYPTLASAAAAIAAEEDERSERSEAQRRDARRRGRGEAGGAENSGRAPPRAPSQPSWVAAMEVEAPTYKKRGPTPQLERVFYGETSASGASGSGAGIDGNSSGARTDTASVDARRAQLAAAFGVTTSHVGSLAAGTSARKFSREVLSLARRNPDFVARLEAAIDAFVAGTSARAPLWPMADRVQRMAAHEAAEQCGISTCSYGSGIRRCVNMFRGRGVGPPIARLSEAVRAPESSLAKGETVDGVESAQADGDEVCDDPWADATERSRARARPAPPPGMASSGGRASAGAADGAWDDDQFDEAGAGERRSAIDGGAGTGPHARSGGAAMAGAVEDAWDAPGGQRNLFDLLGSENEEDEATERDSESGESSEDDGDSALSRGDSAPDEQEPRASAAAAAVDIAPTEWASGHDGGAAD